MDADDVVAVEAAQVDIVWVFDDGDFIWVGHEGDPEIVDLFDFGIGFVGGEAVDPKVDLDDWVGVAEGATGDGRAGEKVAPVELLEEMACQGVEVVFEKVNSLLEFSWFEEVYEVV